MSAGAVIAAVFVGGCLGGLSRHLLVAAWPQSAEAFPWAVFLINCSGSFLLGALMVLVPDGLWRRVIGTGFLGALTTFSAVVLSVDELIAADRLDLAATYLVASAAGGLVCVLAGCLAVRRLAHAW